MNNLEVKKRLNDFFATQYLTKTQIAAKLGVTQPYISKLLSLKNDDNIGLNAINKIAKTFNLNREWLLTGDGSMTNVQIKIDGKNSPVIYGKGNNQQISQDSSSEKLIQVLEREIEAKDTIIEMLKKENDELKKGLKKGV